MTRDKGRLDLRRDMREALTPYVAEERLMTAMTAAMMALLPHFELSYKRGIEAAKGRASARLVQENERLRRELEDGRRHYEIAARAIARVREYAKYHATQCEEWCCDHAPELQKLIDDEE